MLLDTIGFYYFISLALPLARDHKVIVKQSSWPHFLAHVSADPDEVELVLKQFKLSILILLLSKIW